MHPLSQKNCCTRVPAQLLLMGLLLLSVAACRTTTPKKFALPQQIREASGVVTDGENLIWHNDSGDGPYLYTTDRSGKLLHTDTLDAGARDYEDITRSNDGTIYVGDFGNNTGKRSELRIYRYLPETKQTDSIVFSYPGGDGSGRGPNKNYDCEAMVVDGDMLHLFTKDMLFGERSFYVKHFRLPTTPGTYVAELVDSLYLPRRVVTGATLDRDKGELYLVAYNFRMLLGFWPSSAASLIRITGYTDDRYLEGRVKRRNISWAWPTQHEAVTVFDDRYLYIGAEATRLRKHAIGRRLRRR